MLLKKEIPPSIPLAKNKKLSKVKKEAVVYAQTGLCSNCHAKALPVQLRKYTATQIKALVCSTLPTLGVTGSQCLSASPQDELSISELAE